MKRKRLGRTVLSLSGVIIFAIILYLGGTEALSRVAHGDPVYLFATLIVIGCITLIGALRWRILVSALTQQPYLPVRQIYHYNILGRFIGLFAPRGVGDFAGRPLALRAGGGSTLGLAVYSTLIDRMFDYLLLAILVIPALLYVTRVVSLEVGTFLSLILVVAFFFIISTRFGRLVRWLNYIMGKIGTFGNRVPLMANLFSQERVKRFQQLEEIHIENRTASSAYLLSILQFLLIILRSYLIGLALGIDLPYTLLLLASPIAQLGQFLAFTPGALGFRELGWYSVLQTSDIPTEDLITFLVGHRAYIYFCIMVLALISQVITLIHPATLKPLSTVTETEQQET
jgi:uncharacterized protein (TIRG00374 family)